MELSKEIDLCVTKLSQDKGGAGVRSTRLFSPLRKFVTPLHGLVIMRRAGTTLIEERTNHDLRGLLIKYHQRVRPEL